jgi:hypothetical protein
MPCRESRRRTFTNHAPHTARSHDPRLAAARYLIAQLRNCIDQHTEIQRLAPLSPPATDARAHSAAAAPPRQNLPAPMTGSQLLCIVARRDTVRAGAQAGAY